MNQIARTMADESTVNMTTMSFVILQVIMASLLHQLMLLNPYRTFPHDAGIDDRALDCMIVDGARGELDDANGIHAEAGSSRTLPHTVISHGVCRVCKTGAMHINYHFDDGGIRFNEGGTTNDIGFSDLLISGVLNMQRRGSVFNKAVAYLPSH